MDLTSLKIIKHILRKHRVSPKKYLGQNFLTNEGVVKRVADAAHIQPDDLVLEIGPGLGTLTKELAQRAKLVIAVEKDQNMVQILNETLADSKNVKVLYGDILKTNFQFLISNFQTSSKTQIPKRYKLVSNLPYYITAPVIRKFLEAERKPESLTLMVQKEVAQRICAKPPNMNLLAVSVQFYAKPRLLFSVGRAAFWPQPEVDAAILEVTPALEKPQVDPKNFFHVVKTGFKQPRKQLLNNLSKGLNLPRERVEQWLHKNQVEPTQRAQTLSIQDWTNLTVSFAHVFHISFKNP